MRSTCTFKGVFSYMSDRHNIGIILNLSIRECHWMEREKIHLLQRSTWLTGTTLGELVNNIRECHWMERADIHLLQAVQRNICAWQTQYWDYSTDLIKNREERDPPASKEYVSINYDATLRIILNLQESEERSIGKTCIYSNHLCL